MSFLKSLLGGDSEDKSIIEISDKGSIHNVIEVPTSAVEGITQDLENAGIQKEDIDTIPRRSIKHRMQESDQRHPQELRYDYSRIIDEAEDLEDNHDFEDDRADYEEDYRYHDSSDYELSENPLDWEQAVKHARIQSKRRTGRLFR